MSQVTESRRRVLPKPLDHRTAIERAMPERAKRLDRELFEERTKTHDNDVYVRAHDGIRIRCCVQVSVDHGFRATAKLDKVFTAYGDKPSQALGKLTRMLKYGLSQILITDPEFYKSLRSVNN